MESSRLHVAILSSPGMGHLIPTLMLGTRLINHHEVDVTILVVTTHSSLAESQFLPKIGNKVLFDNIELLPIDISDLVDPGPKVVMTHLAKMMREARPRVRSIISSMNHRPDVLVVDHFGTESLEIADEFDIPKYIYIPTTAWYVALSSYCQILDKEVKGQYVDQKEPLRLPGCKPVQPEDVVDPMMDRNDPQYTEYVRQGSEFSLADGILVNTWEDLECTSLKALRDNEIMRSVVKVPIYAVGPLMRPVEQVGSKTELLEWLDMQPSESVLYVSFGSGGTMSREQVVELAWGLELSQQRFIWVVRPPMDGHPDHSFFTAGNGPEGTPDYLPDGFLTRTHTMGIVVPLWAPQVDILSHLSVGGFLSHCGWNSILESIVNGVPIIAWPLYAEQRLNARLLTEELGVAVRPNVLPTKKIVERDEIEKMVRMVMMESKEGKVMKERVKDLKYSADRTLSKGGSSYNSMCEVIKVSQVRRQSHMAKAGTFKDM